MTSVSPDPAPRKDFRLGIRLTAEQDLLIRDASRALGQSLTEFVSTAALVRAEEALADRRLFRLDDAAWEQFTQLLDRPAQRIEELAILLETPAPWDS